MAIAVKVCGLTALDGLEAAAGARYVGFIFYPPSPRYLELAAAAALADAVPEHCAKVGVVVDPDDQFLAELLAAVPLDYLQLHGRESPARVAEVKAATGRPVIKAISIAASADLAPVAAHAEVADLLLFDAKPPPTPGSLPGGNGLAFDWRLLAGLKLHRPWLLSGGLSAANLETAVRLCGAAAVDVSSGVEARPGVKDPAKIQAFLEIAAGLDLPAGHATRDGPQP